MKMIKEICVLFKLNSIRRCTGISTISDADILHC
jgi:hypothetical protein